MLEEIEQINEVFQSHLAEDDLGCKVEDVLEWNSFQIMEFMAEMDARYSADVTIEQLAEIDTVADLVCLVQQCCISSFAQRKPDNG